MHEERPGLLRTSKALQWKDDWVSYFEVEKGGTISLKDLYIHLHRWFVKEQFSHWQSGDNRIEDLYLHRNRTDGMQENLFWWRATRKINDYVYYMCKLDVQNFGSKPTEIMHNGKKIKADKIGIVMRFWWWVQYDPYNRWNRSVLGKMQQWFFQYLLYKEQENHRDKLLTISHNMEDELKHYLNLTTSKPMPRSFFPEEGYRWEKPKSTPEEFKGRERKGDERLV